MKAQIERKVLKLYNLGGGSKQDTSMDDELIEYFDKNKELTAENVFRRNIRNKISEIKNKNWDNKCFLDHFIERFPIIKFKKLVKKYYSLVLKNEIFRIAKSSKNIVDKDSS